MECPNCGIKNDETRTRCAACFTPFTASETATLNTSSAATTTISSASKSTNPSEVLTNGPEVTERVKRDGPIFTALYVAGMIGGYFVGQYSGIHLLFPFGVIAGYAVLFRLLFKTTYQPYRLLLAIVAGQLTVLVVGVVMTGAQMAIWPDLLAFGIGLIWLIVRPGFAPLIYLAVVEAIVLTLNARLFMASPYGSLPHRALLATMAIRGWAIFLISMLAYRISRDGPGALAVGWDEDAGEFVFSPKEWIKGILHEGESVQLSTKAMAGRVQVRSDAITFDGDKRIEILLASIRSVERITMPAFGTIVKINANGKTFFIALVTFQIGGYIILGDLSKTLRFYRLLKAQVARQQLEKV